MEIESISDSDQPQMEEPQAVLDPIQSPEYLQRKLYFLLEQLKKMHDALPEYVKCIICFHNFYLLCIFLLPRKIVPNAYTIRAADRISQFSSERYDFRNSQTPNGNSACKRKTFDASSRAG